MDYAHIRVLFTGRYVTDYNRTLVLRTGLQNLGVQLVEFPFTKKDQETRAHLRDYDQQVDFVFLPSFTHMDVRFVRAHTRKPLVFDPLISKYMTKVYDYKQVWRYSPRALKNYYKDRIAMNAADAVIADTEQHRRYFSDVIRIPEDKISIVPVGADVDKFFPIAPPPDDGVFRVGFYGGYIPLHGIDRILGAARLLIDRPDIHFEIVGNGFEEKKIKTAERRDPLRNLTFTDIIAYDQLNQKINTFDVCLGVFGDGIKTGMVVPNKVFHYAACGRCIITRDTPAIREVFTHQQDIVLCKGTAQEIANAVLQLKENPEVRRAIATAARRLIVQRYNQDAVARQLLSVALRLGQG